MVADQGMWCLLLSGVKGKQGVSCGHFLCIYIVIFFLKSELPCHRSFLLFRFVFLSKYMHERVRGYIIHDFWRFLHEEIHFWRTWVSNTRWCLFSVTNSTCIDTRYFLSRFSVNKMPSIPLTTCSFKNNDLQIYLFDPRRVRSMGTR